MSTEGFKEETLRLSLECYLRSSRLGIVHPSLPLLSESKIRLVFGALKSLDKPVYGPQ